jgi:hypothetical protein
VEPYEQRVKLARVAVAAAPLFFSIDEGGPNTVGGSEPHAVDPTKVVVQPEHVEFAWQLLERLYAKPSLAFDEYAMMQNRRFEITHEERVRIIISQQPGAAEALMEQEQLTQRDLAEILGLEERTQLREAVGVLRDSGFLRRQGTSYYLKTSGAVTWLRRYLADTNGRSNGAMPQLAVSHTNGATSTYEDVEEIPF